MQSHCIVLLIMLTAILGLTACAAHRPQIKYIHVGNDPAMVRLNQIAEKAERSTAILADIQTAQADSNVTLQGAKRARLARTATPKGWGKRINMSFQGPFNKVVYSLAEQAGYQLFTQGQRPANIPIVTIDARNKTLKQILDKVIGQLPQRVAIAIYPRTRSVIVIYAKGSRN